jgi:hypothetical protein
MGVAVLAAALVIRIGVSGLIMGYGLGDSAGVRALPLLPLRDLAGMVSWFLAFTKRTVNWRGTEFILAKGGRLIPKQPPAK